MARFEKERTVLVHQETLKDLKCLQLEQEKLHKKVLACEASAGSVTRNFLFRWSC